MPSAEVAGDVAKKERAHSPKNDVFHTKPCLFSYLLEAPKCDMREAYAFGMQNQGCLGRKASSNRGPITQSGREQEKKFALQRFTCIIS